MFGWFKKEKPRDEEIEDELNYHLAMLADERLEEGEDDSQVRFFATRKFGNKTLMKEMTREVWRWAWAEQVLQDIRFGIRMLRKNPGFTGVAILTLAIGIGANTALFTAMDAVFWKLLPVREPERLVSITSVRSNGRGLNGIPSAFVEELKRSSIFSDVITISWDGLSLEIGDTAERIMGEVVTPNYFSALGLKPYLGQTFSQKGAWRPEAVLTYDFWRSRFQGDPRVIGATIHINTYPFTIIGIAPEGFFGTEVGKSPELRIPLMPPGQSLDQIALASNKRIRVMSAFARLSSGVTMAQAEAVADARFVRFLAETDRRVEGIELRHIHLSSAARGTSDIRRKFGRPLAILFVAVGLLLSVACSTVANLVLARTSARRQEIAVRIAIGAGRGRLLRQLLAESVLLSSLGGFAGLALSVWVTRLLFRYLPQTHELIILDLQPDNRALWFTFGVAILTGLLFGVIPSMQATRGLISDALKADSAASIGTSYRKRWIDFRRMLVAGQVVLSMLLLYRSSTFNADSRESQKNTLWVRP